MRTNLPQPCRLNPGVAWTVCAENSNNEDRSRFSLGRPPLFRSWLIGFSNEKGETLLTTSTQLTLQMALPLLMAALSP